MRHAFVDSSGWRTGRTREPVGCERGDIPVTSGLLHVRTFGSAVLGYSARQKQSINSRGSTTCCGATPGFLRHVVGRGSAGCSATPRLSTGSLRGRGDARQEDGPRGGAAWGGSACAAPVLGDGDAVLGRQGPDRRVDPQPGRCLLVGADDDGADGGGGDGGLPRATPAGDQGGDVAGRLLDAGDRAVVVSRAVVGRRRRGSASGRWVRGRRRPR